VHLTSITPWQKPRSFLVVEPSNEARTLWAGILTAITMGVEILAGLFTGSMALLADGWHMGTHLAALGVAFAAYLLARRYEKDSRFAFGTGKITVLGGFTSAIILAMVGFMMILESLLRLLAPQPIQYSMALIVAVTGLIVNLACAVILGGPSHSHHSHGPEEDHSHAHTDAHSHSHRDVNLRAAYLHVLADALTSILAIAALLAASSLGWVWMDAAVGIAGGVIVGAWAWNLIRESSGILLDRAPAGDLVDQIRRTIESEEDNRVADLRIWPVGPEKFAAILSLVASSPRPPSHYASRLKEFTQIVHLTVEAHPCTGDGPTHTCCPSGASPRLI